MRGTSYMLILCHGSLKAVFLVGGVFNHPWGRLKSPYSVTPRPVRWYLNCS